MNASGKQTQAPSTNAEVITREDIHGCTLTTDMDFSKVSLKGKNIYNVDFTHAKGLTAKNWLSASHIHQCKLPAGMDFSRVSLQGRDLNGVDFSRVKGLTAKNLLSAKDINFCKIPDGMDFGNVSLNGKSLSGIDLSRTKGLTAKNWLSATSYVCTLPDMDFTGISFANRKIIANFSYVKRITLCQLLTAADESVIACDANIQRGKVTNTMNPRHLNSTWSFITLTNGIQEVCSLTVANFLKAQANAGDTEAAAIFLYLTLGK